jgi:hypothetical protein
MEQLISTILLLVGMFLFLKCVLPPLHLMFDKDRSKKEKEVVNLINFERLSLKNKIKVIFMLIVSFILIGTSTILTINL